MDSNVKICQQCNQFQSFDRGAMKRHVAIFHVGGAFSTLKCRKCLESFYDGDHLMDHFRTSEVCKMVDENPLPNHLQLAFESLVDQIMIPMEIPALSAPDSSAQGGPLISNVRSASPTDPKRITEIKFIDTIDISDDEEAPEENSRSGALSEARTVSTLSVCTVDCLSGLMDVKVEEGADKHHMEMAESAGQVEELEDLRRQSSNASEFQENECSGSAKGVTDRKKVSANIYMNKKCRQLNIISKEDTVKCNKCGSFLKGSHSDGLLDHVKRHLDLPIYACNFCHGTTSSGDGMRYHLKSKHGCSGERSNYKDDSLRYEEEILSAYKEYYQEKDISGHKMGERVKITGKTISVGQTNHSRKQTNEVNNGHSRNPEVIPDPLTRCSGKEGVRSKSGMSLKMTVSRNNTKRGRFPVLLDFFRKYSRNGSITCLLCSDKICTMKVKIRNGKQITETETIRAREHIYRHLDHPLFKCQHCGLEKPTIAKMTTHMLKHSGKRGRSGIVNQIILFEKEINEMTKACFDFGQQAIVNDHQENGYQFENGCYSDARHQITADISIGDSLSLEQIMELLPGANQIPLPDEAKFDRQPFQCGECGLQIWNRFLAERHSQIIHGKQKE